MKNLYNEIENNLKKGLCVTVKDLGDNDYCSILNHKDMYGNYRNSGCWGSMEESKQNIGLCDGIIRKYLDNKDLEIVEVCRPEFEPFKIGQKVRLLDSIKETENWHMIRDYFSDMKGKIEGVYNYIIGKHYKVNGLYVGHEFLAPLVEEEAEELTLSEVCKLLGKNIKIKK
jgi:hypothetical protein